MIPRRLPSRCPILTCLVLICLSGLVRTAPLGADETRPSPIPLFQGENLNGWHAVGCEAAVEDGKLVILSGNGLLRSDLRYDDFVLELDWRARKTEQYDSGIYFRCELPPEGQPFPARYQVNLKQGDEGTLIGFPQTRQSGLIKSGDWNHFRLVVQEATAALEINGQPAWKTDGVTATDGFVGLQVEVPLGGQFEFKDIVITELNHRPLFDGQSLAGWEGAGQDAAKCWKAEDGLLICTGEKGPWLRSHQEFGDFDLRLEYRVQEGGNSGVYVRVPADGDHHGPGAGVEIQVLDDRAARYRELKPYQYSGSVYAIAPAGEHVGYEPGVWNVMEIECRGPDYRIIHNGVVVTHAKPDEFPELRERRLAGFLGLQNHSEEVAFRRLRIRQFPPAESSAPPEPKD